MTQNNVVKVETNEVLHNDLGVDIQHGLLVESNDPVVYVPAIAAELKRISDDPNNPAALEALNYMATYPGYHRYNEDFQVMLEYLLGSMEQFHPFPPKELYRGEALEFGPRRDNAAKWGWWTETEYFGFSVAVRRHPDKQPASEQFKD